MDIVITAWALDSYLELKHGHVFTDAEYWETIRPDVLRLGTYPTDAKFANAKFWSVAADPSSGTLANGYKMKWHQMGPGLVQLRLPVAMLGKAYLCAAYAKGGDKEERRRLAKFKTHIALIRQGTYTERGILK